MSYTANKDDVIWNLTLLKQIKDSFFPQVSPFNHTVKIHLKTFVVFLYFYKMSFDSVGEKLLIFPAHINTPHLLLPWKFGVTKCSSRLWVTDIPKGLDDIGGHRGACLWPLFPWQRDTALGNIGDLWLGGGPGECGRIVRDKVYEVRGVWKRKGNMEAQNKYLHT